MRVISGRVDEKFNLYITFDDGTWVLDLKAAGFDHPKFLQLLTDREQFAKMELEDGFSPSWPNGFCLDPEQIRELGTKL